MLLPYTCNCSKILLTALGCTLLDGFAIARNWLRRRYYWQRNSTKNMKGWFQKLIKSCRDHCLLQTQLLLLPTCNLPTALAQPLCPWTLCLRARWFTLHLVVRSPAGVSVVRANCLLLNEKEAIRSTYIAIQSSYLNRLDGTQLENDERTRTPYTYCKKIDIHMAARNFIAKEPQSSSLTSHLESQWLPWNGAVLGNICGIKWSLRSHQVTRSNATFWLLTGSVM